ncbi:hypothetical protein ACFE04_013667 [Oxalis oulophora]
MDDDTCVGFNPTITEVEEDSKGFLVFVSEQETVQTSPKKVKSCSFESMSNLKEHPDVGFVSCCEIDKNIGDSSVEVMKKGDILDDVCEKVGIFGDVVIGIKDCNEGIETDLKCVEEIEKVDEGKNRVGELEMACGGNGITSCFDVNDKDVPIEVESVLESKKNELLARIDGILPRTGNGHVKGPDDVIDIAKGSENKGNNNEKGKQSRRSKAREEKRQFETSQGHQNLVSFQEDADQSKSMYSKEKMLALRFVNVADQRKKWRSVYKSLAPDLVKEYDSLVASKKQKNANFTPNPPTKIGKKGGVNEIRNVRNDEMANMSPTCGGGKVVNEECSEDYDSDDDDHHYDSIQRPALYVEGEPNFESGPPEDGLEYLRRVRWEAARVPKVKVAKIDKSRLKNEQSVYMPQIPEIAKCPEHLLPLKQWEDQFLADFSSLRLALVPLCDSGNEQSISILHEENSSCPIPENILEKFQNLRTDDTHSNPPFNSFEQSSTSNPEKNKALNSLENQSSNNDTCPDYPLLSEIVKMTPVTRVSMLRKRINSLETVSILSKSDSVWLFSLCAAVDTPLDADTSASIRSLLRKCASLRANKLEVDDESAGTLGSPIADSCGKMVTLQEWWLLKTNEANGLAVGGLASTQYASFFRNLDSAAISKRHSATILETTDAVTITLSGCIDRSRTRQNGFSLEVCNHFRIGFPYYWENPAQHNVEALADRTIPTEDPHNLAGSVMPSRRGTHSYIKAAKVTLSTPMKNDDSGVQPRRDFSSARVKNNDMQVKEMPDMCTVRRSNRVKRLKFSTLTVGYIGPLPPQKNATQNKSYESFII